MKLLSIAVPSYNVEKTLGDTLGSLCIPALLPALDIMVIDDGSCDRTAEVAQQYVKRYPQSVRLISQPNKGHGGAVNTGIFAAVGKYFKVVDGDDTLDKQGLTRLLDTLKEEKADLVLAHYVRVPQGDFSNLQPMRFEHVEFDHVYQFGDLPIDKGLYFGIHSITIWTDILRRHHVQLQEHTFYVDMEYGLLPIPFIKTILFIDTVVYQYAVGSETQSVATSSFVKRFADHDRVVRRLVRFNQETPLDAARRAYTYSVLRKLCFTQYMIAAFYDADFRRGGWRARRFDAWLKQADNHLYKMMGENAYLRLLRHTRFQFPRTATSKAIINGVYHVLKPILKVKKKFTY
ncbi:MAG TPA: glycosyltransferase family 2 protein [Ruminococcaceae bacterium]|nr:glycosyltransferase family 2 protein [Oscillospiraceae bacterium]